MNQNGYIVEVTSENTAMFKMQRQSACASCGKCFGSKSSESQDIIVEVSNDIGAHVGDHVEVSMDQVNVMKAVGIAYGFPLIALIIGSVGSYYILQAFGLEKSLEVLSFFIGIIFTGAAYYVIKRKDAAMRESKKYMPTVTRILIDLNLAKDV
ncbi:SoxR reducing system RseC family protein [Peptostreptococcus faecalis]|uniref:SoxR reducing system RseC family protein n=1 Tax=Peptostreptococcus faecalis TaxID=2045015 RepID=UPI000C7A13B0|nr:SoxR reducing system RseC family protein [Peptostreptococcus faecalis]